MLNFEDLKIVYKRGLRLGIVALLLCTLSLGLSAAWGGQPPRESSLPPGNAITDGKALLRYALPIDNQTARDLQKTLEDIAAPLRSRRWSPVTSGISKASSILKLRDSDLIDGLPEDQKPKVEALLAAIKDNVTQMQAAVEAKDKPQVQALQAKTLDLLGQVEAAMVPGFPVEVPAEYANLPQLQGRATVNMETSKGVVTLVVDGYNAPVTAGNFVDLVQRGFYNGLEFIRSEESYVLQTGDPAGPDDGFIDPTTGKYRSVPLEVMVRGDKVPTYSITLEDAGRFREQPVLPFSAYGTVAMARREAEPDSGSSQFFFFLFEPELTPAGLNLLDGRYSVFGYVVDGQDVLRELKQGDKVISAEVIEGIENLVTPKAA